MGSMQVRSHFPHHANHTIPMPRTAKAILEPSQAVPAHVSTVCEGVLDKKKIIDASTS